MRNDKENIIVNKTIEFSVNVINYCEFLEGKRKYAISRQLIRAGTSIGANVFDAQNAESKADFIHKMKIAAKEASESLDWMILCERIVSYEFNMWLRDELNQIIMILSKIISSSKANNLPDPK